MAVSFVTAQLINIYNVHMIGAAYSSVAFSGDEMAIMEWKWPF